MKRPKIVSLGEVLWDLFPEGPRFGGAPANFACHASLVGANVTMVSAVGADARGNEALSILKGFGINVSFVSEIPESPTGVVVVSLDASGEPTFTIEEGAAWDQLAWSSGLETYITTMDAIYFGTLGQRRELSRSTIRCALEVAKQSEIRRVLDINLRAPFYSSELIRESVEQCSILKLSDDELDDVTNACGISGAGSLALLKALRNQFDLEIVVMTRGANGAILISSEETVEQAGIPAEVRDTVGAGDAFTATLVNGLCNGESLTAIGRKACEYAAAVCSLDGAVPNLPTSEL